MVEETNTIPESEDSFEDDFATWKKLERSNRIPESEERFEDGLEDGDLVPAYCPFDLDSALYAISRHRDGPLTELSAFIAGLTGPNGEYVPNLDILRAISAHLAKIREEADNRAEETLKRMGERKLEQEAHHHETQPERLEKYRESFVVAHRTGSLHTLLLPTSEWRFL